MYRSVSWSRDPDDFFMQTSPKPVPAQRSSSATLAEGNELPAYDPTEEMVRKEKSRIKFAENAVHFIPLVLLLCAFILWLFSNPNVDVGFKADSAAAKIEGVTIEGDIDTDSDGTQTSILPVELEDIDKQTNRAFRKLVKNFHFEEGHYN